MKTVVVYPADVETVIYQHTIKKWVVSFMQKVEDGHNNFWVITFIQSK